MRGLQVIISALGLQSLIGGDPTSPPDLSAARNRYKYMNVLGTSSDSSLGSSEGSPTGNSCRQIQYDFTTRPREPDARAESIKQAYIASWEQYEKYAFGWDDIRPLSREPGGAYGWGLDIVDGIDTALVMGLTSIVDKQLAFIDTADFTTSDQLQDQFDVTIRFIGGLLSAYDLIMEDKVPDAAHYNRTQVASLLRGARTLADLLKPCFDTPSGLPHFWINTTSHEASDGPYPYYNPLDGKTYTAITNTAIAGTIILEFHRLSDLIGDESYRLLADRAEANLLHPKPEPIYPNLVGSMLNLDTGEFFAYDAGWQSGIDSFYEYLIKSVIYDPAQPHASQYEDFWTGAVNSTMEHLISHPQGHPELTFITQLNETGAPRYFQDDYACFAGGNFLLGGAYLSRPDLIDLGLAHADSCHRTYNATASGLNPLSFAWYGPEGQLGAGVNNSAVNTTTTTTTTPPDPSSAPDPGFHVDGQIHTLYPETVESMFYAWRVTGDEKWRDYVWDVFQATQRAGNRDPTAPMTCLWDVTMPRGGDQWDMLPSYYFAETLKYMYLTFSDPELVSVDEFVFNTEAHPLRVQGGRSCGTESGAW